MSRDPWDVLGIPPTASYADARQAYVVRSQLLHPDRHQGAPAEVVAEAERAMRELNAAWHEVSRLLSAGAVSGADPGPVPGSDHGSGPGADPRPAPGSDHGPGPAATGDPSQQPPPDAGAAACAEWVIGRMQRAAINAGDPMGQEERARLRLPLTDAPRGRRFEQWLDHRRATLAAAMEDSGDWQRTWRTIAEGDLRTVLLLLIDPRPGG